MWDVFLLPETFNKEKKWDLLIHQYRFLLEYMKRHVQSFQKEYEAYQYFVQNLKWPVVYLRSNV